ncbi:MAG: exosortase/archaeosortase family protein [Candidatus Bathyarchaeota archaeon]|nr:archaeosortase/exosortase family protein [Candidatus Bathyarchaeota archaeon A05DMB-5]MDH7557309.1 exosortase/archaeosortase family protein [Candidatus Bathyarchaeota archaeon]
MLSQTLRKYNTTVMILLPLFSIITPFAILYFYQDIAYPPYPTLYNPEKYTNTFEATWKGRTFYIFFLWLFVLEMIFGWEELIKIKHKLKSIKTLILILALILPTIYTITANFYGINKTIIELTYQKGADKYSVRWVPLSTEYLVFTVLFALTVLVGQGITGLMNYSISITFLGIIGLIYTIDNLYPNGQFTPFQILVPTTAILAARVLNLMGYQTTFLDPQQGMPHLQVNKSWDAVIAWGCSGIDSLIIYSVTILLFLKKSAIPMKQRIIYFVIGAAVTYFINILRIATIFIIGVNGGDWETFHNFYGQLYSITWIVSYPLIIIGTRALWSKIRSWKVTANSEAGFSHQTKPSTQTP